MRWVVLGAGAIGGGLGGALARAGEEVHLIARGARLQALQRDGLRWQTPDLDETLMLSASSVEDASPRPGDVLCLATKLQDAQAALRGLGTAWGEVPLVCWTNGIQAPGWAAERHDTVLACAVNVPASIEAPAVARLWSRPHYGAMHVGVSQGEGDALRDALVAALARAGFDAFGHDDVAPYVNAKWCTNLMGAAQALVVPEDFEAVALAALAEGRAVLQAAGWPLVSTEALSPRPISLGSIDGEPRGGGSTWKSLQQGKPLESPWLNGPLVELAEAEGLAAPLNRALLEGVARATRERWSAPRLRRSDLPL